MFGIKALSDDVQRLESEVTILRAHVGHLLSMDAVAALVQIGKDAATLSTEPMRQFDMAPDDLERYRERLCERGHTMIVDGADQEAEAMAAWRTQGTGREE